MFMEIWNDGLSRLWWEVFEIDFSFNTSGTTSTETFIEDIDRKIADKKNKNVEVIQNQKQVLDFLKDQASEGSTVIKSSSVQSSFTTVEFLIEPFIEKNRTSGFRKTCVWFSRQTVLIALYGFFRLSRFRWTDQLPYFSHQYTLYRCKAFGWCFRESSHRYCYRETWVCQINEKIQIQKLCGLFGWSGSGTRDPKKDLFIGFLLHM